MVVLLGMLSVIAIPKMYNMIDNARLASFESYTGAVKSGISTAYSLKKGEFPTVNELIANSYSVNGITHQIMGAQDFELSLSASPGAKLVGTLPAEPTDGTWEEIFIYSPDADNPEYYSLFWYNEEEGKVVDGL